MDGKQKTIRKCKLCGENFTPTNNSQRYCIPCGKIHRKTKQREYSEAHYTRYHGGKQT